MARSKAAAPAPAPIEDPATTAVPRGVYKIRGNRSDTVIAEPEDAPAPVEPLSTEA